MTSKDLLGAVLGLPLKERAQIAHELLLSLDESNDLDDDDRGLVEELDRRRLLAEAGEVHMMERDEFADAIARRRVARRSR